MSASSKSNRLLGALLAGIALALAGLTAYEWQAGQGLRARLEREVRSGVAQAEPTRILPPFALQTMNAYSGIVQHPLFTPNRQPAPAVGASAAPPRKLILTGIATDGGTSVVLLKDLQTGKTERVRAGTPGDAEGLQLESVNGTNVVLKQGGTQFKLDLQVAPSASTGAPTAGAQAQREAPPVGAIPPAGEQTAARVPPPRPTASAPHPAPSAKSGADANLLLFNQQRAKQGLPPLAP